MNEPTSLIKLDEVTRALAEMRRIDDVKDIHDKAEAMRIYAKQAKLGLESQNHAAEIKLRAERRAGELLRDMDKHPGGNTSNNLSQSVTGSPPTLSDLGVSRRQSSNWQRIAALPEGVFEQQIAETKADGSELTSADLLRTAKGMARDTARAQVQAARVTDYPSVLTSGIWQGDMRELGERIPDNSIDLIFTDPPYPREFLPLFTDLAILAARVLKPGAPCLVYSGQIFLPEVINRLSEHLEYVWTCAIRHTGGAERMFKPNVNTGWKPVLFFVKPPLKPYWDSFQDMVSGGREKDLHDWQQAESEAAHFISALCPAEGVVLDPFAGSGTTLIASRALNLRCIGIELDANMVNRIEERIRDT